MGIKRINHKDTEFYARLFYESEEGPFEVTLGCTHVCVIMKPLTSDTKLYVF